MKGPYGMETNEHCQVCRVKTRDFFCQFAAPALKDFDEMRSAAAYPEGAVLFLEKQEPRGVFVLCEGEVKLSISSSGGKTLILRIAKPGEALGLMSTLAGVPYEVTAETIRPCRVAHIGREDFLEFIAKHPDVYQGVVRQMTSLYEGACRQLRTVGLSASVPERLARLLLEWSEDGKETEEGTPVRVRLTHEEIAELIGTTRETVTRTLSQFKSKNLVAMHGSNLMISNRAALESLGSE
ncbi:MAG TPA: Crp/Fnr family transcriptional regulator [Candidatus Acidoferrum sp.]|nr:Crp/Fnr family transcriptional regulator [Candidatus Acidoferrum sp.]